MSKELKSNLEDCVATNSGATNYFTFEEPRKNTYILHLTPAFQIYLPGKIPNKFHQWWIRFLMGIKIEGLKDEN